MGINVECRHGIGMPHKVLCILDRHSGIIEHCTVIMPEDVSCQPWDSVDLNNCLSLLVMIDIVSAVSGIERKKDPVPHAHIAVMCNECSVSLRAEVDTGKLLQVF